MDNDGPSKAITADHVAELAGVSRWTVTRAFKPGSPVSEKTRSKIMKAAEELGYAPDLLASSLASDRSNLVALLVDDFANPHKLVMMERLTRILRKHGWDTLLVNTLNESDASSALLTASQRRVDAAVLIGLQFDDKVLETALGARRVRKLILFARYSDNPNTISICCDDVRAMSTITDYVIEKGYKRPLFLAGPQTESAHLMRKETFRTRWFEATGNTARCSVVDSYDPNLAYQSVMDHLIHNPRDEWPDVIVCENDALAMGAINAARYEFNLSVPRDLAVTGFDDVPQAASPNYRLTTYRQPITAMAEGLVSVLKGEADPKDLALFEGRMISRQSA